MAAGSGDDGWYRTFGESGKRLLHRFGRGDSWRLRRNWRLARWLWNSHARAVLATTGDEIRKVWLFDSFAGLPKPDVKNYPQDEPDRLWTFNEYLGVSVAEVKANFERFDLLDERTRFVEGWFRDTIPKAKVDSISVLRLDGDLYESNWLVLDHLYPKVSPGGFVIIDDYALPTCKAAVDDFRAKHSIHSPITTINWSGIFWRK